MAPPKRPWFRFYVEAVHDRKLRRLKPEHRWLFVACLAAARQSCEPGWLLVGKDDPMQWGDLVDFAAMTLKQVEAGTDALQDAGVLSYDQQRGAWFIPAWSERQYESDDVSARTAKHRSKTKDGTSKERSKNADRPFDGTPPDTETDTEVPSSVGSSTAVAPTVPPSAAPLKGRISKPNTFVELVEPSGPVAIRVEATAILAAAGQRTEHAVTPSEQRTLRPVVEDALRAGYDPNDLADAVASAPFRTRNGVMGELRKRKQAPTSVGNRGLEAVGRFLEEGA